MGKGQFKPISLSPYMKRKRGGEAHLVFCLIPGQGGVAGENPYMYSMHTAILACDPQLLTCLYGFLKG